MALTRYTSWILSATAFVVGISAAALSFANPAPGYCATCAVQARSMSAPLGGTTGQFQLGRDVAPLLMMPQSFLSMGSMPTSGPLSGGSFASSKLWQPNPYDFARYGSIYEILAGSGYTPEYYGFQNGWPSF